MSAEEMAAVAPAQQGSPGGKPNGAATPDAAADPLLADFEARIARLPNGASGGAVDALLSEIAASAIEPWVFPRLAAAIAKATGYDRGELLKRLVKARTARENAANETAGFDTDLAPAADPKPLARVLDAVAESIRRQVWCSGAAIDAIALWCTATYGYWEAWVFPRLLITAPDTNCGKSTALEAVELVAYRPRHTDNTSAPAMYRRIEKGRITLCIDEYDSFAVGNEDFRNIVNAGFKRTATIDRCDKGPKGETTLVTFRCFCPVAIAGIGKNKVPETICNRSVRVHLHRASPEIAEKLAKLREKEREALRAKNLSH